MRKVLVIDTSVLCVWLKVPGKETCGPSNALVTIKVTKSKTITLDLDTLTPTLTLDLDTLTPT